MATGSLFDRMPLLVTTNTVRSGTMLVAEPGHSVLGNVIFSV